MDDDYKNKDLRFQRALNCLLHEEVKALAQKIFDGIRKDGIKDDDFSIFWDDDERMIEFYVPSKYEIRIYDESEK
jgi:hypothetical protein